MLIAITLPIIILNIFINIVDLEIRLLEAKDNVLIKPTAITPIIKEMLI